MATFKIYAGIDPGINGAIAIIDSANNEVIDIFDMPSMANLAGSGNQINHVELSSILMQYGIGYCTIEKVHSMPGQGVATTFKFGYSFGIICGVLGALQIPTAYVAPGIWKKSFGLTGKDKDAARAYTISMMPYLGDRLRLKKHVDRADAVLIGLYGVNLCQKK